LSIPAAHKAVHLQPDWFEFTILPRATKSALALLVYPAQSNCQAGNRIRQHGSLILPQPPVLKHGLRYMIFVRRGAATRHEEPSQKNRARRSRVSRFVFMVYLLIDLDVP
jgi:hypothetical protein